MNDEISFYLPRRYWPSDPLPDHADNPLHYPKGVLTHTLQTFLRLKNSGYPCVLVDTMPRDGIVVAHRSLLEWARFSPDVFLVNMLADRGPHAWAQWVVTQNPVQAQRPRHSLIPQWPQPGLIQRDPLRGERFEVVAYFGRRENLAPELRAEGWLERMRAIGIEWRIVDHPRNNYSDVDAAVAVRDFDAAHVYDFKPAAKLVNSWHAGVVPIAAPEPAHLALRESELDYVTVESADALFEALVRLKADKCWRHALLARGRERAAEFTAERLVMEWQKLLEGVIKPQYAEWKLKSRLSRWIYYAQCCLRWPLDYAERRRIKKDWFRW
jgi:hypothetical protein